MLVPKQFVLMKSSGPAIERSTWLSAAKCTTASCPGHRLLERARVADVALDEPVARAVVDVAQRREVARVRERVVDGDLVVGVGEDVPDVVRADEAGAAGDEDLHGRYSSSMREWSPSIRRLAWGRSWRSDDLDVAAEQGVLDAVHADDAAPFEHHRVLDLGVDDLAVVGDRR